MKRRVQRHTAKQARRAVRRWLADPGPMEGEIVYGSPGTRWTTVADVDADERQIRITLRDVEAT